jgi:glycosyltransferase involved in cell wall biosynthesis
MRIAIFTETFLPKIDGITNTLCYLLDHLHYRGHQVLVIAPDGGVNFYGQIEIVRLPAIPFPLYPEFRLSFPLIDIEKKLNDFSPNIIHVINPISLCLAGIWYAREKNIPLVASYHTDIPGYTIRWGIPYLYDTAWHLLKYIHNQADLNLAPSHHTKNELILKGFKNVEIWGRGVDVNRFNPIHLSPQMRHYLTNGNSNDPLIIFVGRLAVEKRIETLRPLVDACSNLRLAIIGDGPVRNELERLFNGTNTVFTGYLSGSDLSSAYATSDAFVFTGANETFGNVILEAMASGLPVIIPNSGGVLEHIEDSKNGLTYDVSSPKDIIKKTKALIDNPTQRKLMGEVARLTAEKINWAQILDNLIERYENLLISSLNYSNDLNTIV